MVKKNNLKISSKGLNIAFKGTLYRVIKLVKGL